MGKILRIDLTKKEIKDENLPLDILKKYLGGRGLGAKILYKEVDGKISPTSPDAILVFTTGPLTGTTSPTSGRMNLTFKSPLTSGIFDSNCGGRTGVFLKKCGYDGIIVKGISNQPVYIYISEDKIEIKDADFLWGKNNLETYQELKDIYPQSSILSIGPAGENKVLFANIISDYKRAFGRGGAGAVMGSKNLKAIVINSGSRKIEIKNEEKLKFVVYEANKMLRAHPITSKALPEFGTAVLVNVMNEMGILGIKNFQENYSELSYKISGEELKEKILKKRGGCYGCVIACQRITQTKNMKGHGPEFETVWSLGANLGIFDIETIAEANYLCNLYGMDTISCGVTLSCCMEMEERKIAKFGIKFSEKNKLKKYIELIAERKGIGDEMAEGSLRLTKKYKARELAMQVKGLEMPAYDPRGSKGMALTYATSNRGACHLRGGYMISPEALGVPRLIDRFTSIGKASYVVELQNFGAVIDSLVVCRFATFALADLYWARILSSITGIEFEAEDLLKIGERIFNLERLYNLREGFTKKDDTLPERFIKESFKSGPTKGEKVPLEEMLKEYYESRNWDENGIPTKEKLKELELE